IQDGNGCGQVLEDVEHRDALEIARGFGEELLDGESAEREAVAREGSSAVRGGRLDAFGADAGAGGLPDEAALAGAEVDEGADASPRQLRNHLRVQPVLEAVPDVAVILAVAFVIEREK